MQRSWTWALAVVVAFGCGRGPAPAEGEPVDPPFDVRGEAEGLLLVWFDAEGVHTASRRSEIPEAHRAMVRVDDLNLPPEQRLDPEFVYVADLRAPRGAEYTVRRMARQAFESEVDAAANGGNRAVAANDAPAATDGGDIVIYGASWCSACRSAAAYLRQRNVPFVERDIERDPGAREAMMQAAQRAGVSARGIPVIDFRGQVLTGFDQATLARLIDQGNAAI